MAAAITLTWMFAVFFCVIPQVLLNAERRYVFVIFKMGVNIFCSFVMLFSSTWIVKTRNSHSRVIKEQEDVVAKARYILFHKAIGVCYPPIFIMKSMSYDSTGQSKGKV